MSIVQVFYSIYIDLDFFQCNHTSHLFKEVNFVFPSCRLLGVDKLFSYAINEWLNDIKKNQLPGILGGVGPIHSLVQLGKLLLFLPCSLRQSEFIGCVFTFSAEH